MMASKHFEFLTENIHKLSKMWHGAHVPKEVSKIISRYVSFKLKFETRQTLFDDVSFSNRNSTVTLHDSDEPVFGSLIWNLRDLKDPLYT